MDSFDANLTISPKDAMKLMGSMTPAGSRPEEVPELLFEVTGGIVLVAAANSLGNMAKAFHPIAVDALKPEAGEQQVPCVTHSPSRAWDDLREGETGWWPRETGRKPACPHAEVSRKGRVHGLFRLAVAFVLAVGVWCNQTSCQLRAEVRFEVTGGIVLVAAANSLGNMAKAFHPIAVDALLETAGSVT